jgi:hypothetical protein
MTTKHDLTVIDGLAIVRICGFDCPAGQETGVVSQDDPGSANWFCSGYGMAQDDDSGNPVAPGILWTDYDGPGWEFAVLVHEDELGALTDFARENNYEVIASEIVTEPTSFGDGTQGTVEILKHRDGWIVLA